MGKVQYVLLILILLGGFAMRLYRIDNPVADWHSWRQADTASVTRIYVQEGINLLRPRYHDISNIASGYDNPNGWRFVEFPVFNAVHALLYKAYPVFSLEKWGRLTAVSASLVSAVFVFLIGKRFLGVQGGLLSAFFFTAFPFNVYFSRVILPEPFAVLFVVAALWFFIYWLDPPSSRRHVGTSEGQVLPVSWSLLLSGVFFALALLIKPYIGFYVIPMLYLAVSRFGFVGALTNTGLWIFLSLSLSPFFFWRGWMWNEDFLRGIPHWKWAFNGDDIRFKPSFWWWIVAERLGRLILGIWGTIFLVVGLLNKGKGKFPWFLHILLVSQFAYAATVATASVRHDYYQTLMIPAISLVVAAGAIKLWNLESFDKSLRRAATLAITALLLFFSFYQIREFYKINHPEIVRTGVIVDQKLPKEALVIAPYNGDTAFLYQTKRRGWPYITYPLHEMVERWGAQYYVSVNYDAQTKQVMNEYTVIDSTPEYVIIDLTQKK
ncbi:MAG: glycosyltransferase family 39 protein [Candidatus Blackburnbacteria bacterium]|nr:glycosyltransferase family 39 protein [Candidatus Blackburnbacteria bacterium]